MLGPIGLRQWVACLVLLCLSPWAATEWGLVNCAEDTGRPSGGAVVEYNVTSVRAETLSGLIGSCIHSTENGVWHTVRMHKYLLNE